MCRRHKILFRAYWDKILIWSIKYFLLCIDSTHELKTMECAKIQSSKEFYRFKFLGSIITKAIPFQK